MRTEINGGGLWLLLKNIINIHVFKMSRGGSRSRAHLSHTRKYNFSYTVDFPSFVFIVYVHTPEMRSTALWTGSHLFWCFNIFKLSNTYTIYVLCTYLLTCPAKHQKPISILLIIACFTEEYFLLHFYLSIIFSLLVLCRIAE